MGTYEHIIVKLKNEKQPFSYPQSVIKLDKDFIIIEDKNSDCIYLFANKNSVDYVRFNIVLLDCEEPSNKKG